MAAAAGGVLEFARDGHNAILVTPDDAAALAAGIARAVSDDRLREELVAGGRATADELSWYRIAARYEWIYHATLDEAAA